MTEVTGLRTVYSDEKSEAVSRIFVRYFVDGSVYKEELGIMPDVNHGDKLKINYNPDNFSDIAKSTTVVFPIIMLTIGFIVSVSGAINTSEYKKKHFC